MKLTNWSSNHSTYSKDGIHVERINFFLSICEIFDVELHSFIHKGLFRIVIAVKTLNCNNFTLKIHIQSNYIIKQISKSIKLPTIYQRSIALKLNTLTKNTPTSNHQPHTDPPTHNYKRHMPFHPQTSTRTRNAHLHTTQHIPSLIMFTPHSFVYHKHTAHHSPESITL